MTQPIVRRWPQQHGGMQAEEARRQTQLEKENAPIEPKASLEEWELLADAELEKAML